MTRQEWNEIKTAVQTEVTDLNEELDKDWMLDGEKALVLSINEEEGCMDIEITIDQDKLCMGCKRAIWDAAIRAAEDIRYSLGDSYGTWIEPEESEEQRVAWLTILNAYDRWAEKESRRSPEEYIDELAATKAKLANAERDNNGYMELEHKDIFYIQAAMNDRIRENTHTDKEPVWIEISNRNFDKHDQVLEARIASCAYPPETEEDAEKRLKAMTEAVALQKAWNKLQVKEA